MQYNSQGGGGRPAITAAAIACLFNAGDYDSQYVPKLMNYCRKQLDNISNQGFGHWHYAHYYYSQVLYREGGKAWEDYRDKIFQRIISEAAADGSWNQGYIGQTYTTAINLTILQLPKGHPADLSTVDSRKRADGVYPVGWKYRCRFAIPAERG